MLHSLRITLGSHRDLYLSRPQAISTSTFIYTTCFRSLRSSYAYMLQYINHHWLSNGLSHGRCEGIIWTSTGILLIGSLGSKFSEHLIKIYTFYSGKSIWKCRLENGGPLSRPRCVNRTGPLHGRRSINTQNISFIANHARKHGLQYIHTLLSLYVADESLHETSHASNCKTHSHVQIIISPMAQICFSLLIPVLNITTGNLPVIYFNQHVI